MKLKKVKIESLNNEECNIKKMSLEDTMNFRGLDQQESILEMIRSCIVDEEGLPIFPDRKSVGSLPLEVVSDLANLVGEYNEDPEVEKQAKKS